MVGMMGLDGPVSGQRIQKGKDSETQDKIHLF